MNYNNSEYSFTKPRRQTFSLPYGFSNHIFKNSSAELYLKLSMSCKQFFGQKRFIVVESIESPNSVENPGYIINEDKVISIDSMKNNHTKLWITENIYFDEPFKTAASDISKYIFRFDGNYLSLNKQKLSFDEYMFLVKSKNLEEVKLQHCIVRNFDGTFASAVDLLKLLCNVNVIHL